MKTKKIMIIFAKETNNKLIKSYLKIFLKYLLLYPIKAKKSYINFKIRMINFKLQINQCANKK
jgi:hypothetical protein